MKPVLEVTRVHTLTTDVEMWGKSTPHWVRGKAVARI